MWPPKTNLQKRKKIASACGGANVISASRCFKVFICGHAPIRRYLRNIPVWTNPSLFSWKWENSENVRGTSVRWRDENELFRALRKREHKARKVTEESYSLNIKLVSIERCSEKLFGYGPKVDFSKRENTKRLTGLSRERYLHGMLQASNFDATDNVPQILGAIVESVCGPYHTDKTAEALTQCLHAVNFLFIRNFSVKWTERVRKHLEHRIESFENKRRVAFGRYQYFRMLTQNWRALDHISEALSFVGGVESTHTVFS